jgi:hypothetical protein
MANDISKTDQLNLRGLVMVFVGLIGALFLYANDFANQSHTLLWLLAFVGGGASLIARTMGLRRASGPILVAVGVLGAAIFYTDDADNLTYAIVWLLAFCAGGGYLMMFPE